MKKIREIVRLYEQTQLSQRGIAQATGVSRPVVAEYLRWFAASGLTYDQVSELSDSELDGYLRSPKPRHDGRYEQFRQRVQRYLRELGRKGVTRQLLWQEYRREFPDGYGYTQFCFYLQMHAEANEALSMHLEHTPGRTLFIDFAGYAPKLFNPVTGEEQQLELFVATFPASGLVYCEACESQRLFYTVEATQNAIWFAGGAPQIITPDNLRAAVTKADRYEPQINATFADLAEHYGCAVVPARANRPKDKALVERSVNLVYQRVLAPLRDQSFTQLDELNEAIWEKLDELNNASMQQHEISRRERFEQNERHHLQRLPRARYTLRRFRRVKVAFNYHAYLSDDKHYYSVPYGYRGKHVRLAVTHDTVEIYYDHRRIATHRRDPRRGGYTTNKEHMPQHHREYAEWNPERLIGWARKFGEHTESLIAGKLAAKEIPEQSYGKCVAILSLARKYGGRRLEAACRRARHYNLDGYRQIKRILERQLEDSPLEHEREQRLPAHSNIRGGHYYSGASQLNTTSTLKEETR